jgi:hypothetical protein
VADIDDPLTRLAAGLVGGTQRRVLLPTRLCRAAAGVLRCDGAAITLAYTEPERVTLCATDDTALVIDELQDVVGQGPGADAFATGSYTRLDLGPWDDGDHRWPLLASGELRRLAPGTVHAVPLGAPPAVIGVLTLYQLGPDRTFDLDDAHAVAIVLSAAVLADAPSQQGGAHGPWAERAKVHHATGMVVAQLQVPEEDALALIRAHAYSHDQSVARTAHEVVAGRVTFSRSSSRQIDST